MVIGNMAPALYCVIVYNFTARVCRYFPGYQRRHLGRVCFTDMYGIVEFVVQSEIHL
jgi:hypothetical protein